jgi:hypothetical protein
MSVASTITLPAGSSPTASQNRLATVVALGIEPGVERSFSVAHRGRALSRVRLARPAG